MTKDEKNRLVWKWLGHCWHMVDPALLRCKCGVKGPSANPDFTTDSGAVLLLRELMKREDWQDFLSIIGSDTTYLKAEVKSDSVNKHFLVYGVESIQLAYITTPGALLDAVVEWMRREGE